MAKTAPNGKAREKVDPRLRLAGRGSPASRIEAGKAARAKTSREALGGFKIQKRDPIALLKASDAGRVAELVPVRYGRMLASPFAFYRGAAAIMADDLAPLPRSDVYVQLCGDAHLANFGLFASPERRILFGPNDFDETLPGPFDWDIRRLAASFAIAARDRGFDRSSQREAVRHLCATWRRQLDKFSEMDTLDVWYHQFTADKMLAIADSRAERRREQAVVEKAKNRTSRAMAGQMTELVEGRLRILDAPPLAYHVGRNPRETRAFEASVRRVFAAYRETLLEYHRALFDRFELVDVAVRVVGVGSVGTRCYVALFIADGVSPLFLQLKEARASVLERYLGPSQYANHGQRVVVGQRMIQSVTDIFLGWTHAAATQYDFYVRQLRDMKGSFDLETFNVEDLYEYAVSCGYAIARAMSKSGDPAMLRGYAGESDAFDDAMVRFALAYADRNEEDWTLLKAAVKAGRVPASTEV